MEEKKLTCSRDRGDNFRCMQAGICMDCRQEAAHAYVPCIMYHVSCTMHRVPCIASTKSGALNQAALARTGPVVYPSPPMSCRGRGKPCGVTGRDGLPKRRLSALMHPCCARGLDVWAMCWITCTSTCWWW